MQYKQLGKRGPMVSTIGLGTWAIGGKDWGKTDDEVSRAAMREAMAHGVTLFDTADVYGFGHSEDLIAGLGGTERVVIATKAGNDFYNASDKDDKGYGPVKQNYTKQHLIFATEQSLKRLRVESLAILQLHSPDDHWLKTDELWDAMSTLKRDGKVQHLGWSVQSFKETDQAWVLDEHRDVFDCLQVRYNLLEREAEKVLFPKALQYGIGIIVRIPILFGLLSGKFTKDSKFGDDDHRRFNLSAEKLSAYLENLEKLKPLFARFPEQTMAQVSLRFCISHPACQTVIPGAKTAKQVAENCAAGNMDPISAELIPPLSA